MTGAFTWIVTLAAGMTLGFCLATTQAGNFEVPAVPVRGTKIDAPAPVKVGETGEEAEAEPVFIDGAPFLDFATLMFADYDAPELREDSSPLGAQAFPEALRDHEGEQVVLEGYVLAADMANGVVDSMILTRFPPGCCFGSMPVLDEWVDVKVAEGGAEPFSTYLPVMVSGTLHMGEVLDDIGAVESLYRMSDARVLLDEG